MNTCPTCKSPTTKYPAGISKKSGKEYSARTSCENPECDYVLWEPKDKKTPQGANEASNNGIKNAAVEMIFELQKIRELLEAQNEFLLNEKKEVMRNKSWKNQNDASEDRIDPLE